MSKSYRSPGRQLRRLAKSRKGWLEGPREDPLVRKAKRQNPDPPPLSE